VNEALLAQHQARVRCGVKIAGGSDAGTPFNLHEDYAYEVELMHTLVGMTPRQALHAATNVAAELLGLHRGILDAGEPADLLLWKRTPAKISRLPQRRCGGQRRSARRR